MTARADEACGRNFAWAAANQAAAAVKDGDCSLTDKSAPGDWRLPTKAEWEWEATIARAVALECTSGRAGGPPSLTNDAGIACYGTGVGSSFAGVASDIFFWSSTTVEVNPSAWVAFLSFGVVGDFGKINTLRVWPVRGGSR